MKSLLLHTLHCCNSLHQPRVLSTSTMTGDGAELLLLFPSVTTANPSTRGRRASRASHAHTDVLRLQMVRLRNSCFYSSTIFVFTISSPSPSSRVSNDEIAALSRISEVTRFSSSGLPDYDDNITSWIQQSPSAIVICYQFVRCTLRTKSTPGEYRACPTLIPDFRSLPYVYGIALRSAPLPTI